MKNILILASDHADIAFAWQRQYQEAHNMLGAPSCHVVRCHSIREVENTLATIGDDHVAAIITDNSFADNRSSRLLDPHSEGMALAANVRSGAYGEAFRHTPIALKSGGALPLKSPIHPPVVMARIIDPAMIKALLQHQTVVSAYNFEQMRDCHLEALVGAIQPPGANGIHKENFFRTFFSWLRLCKPSKPSQSVIDPNITYQQWQESLPPLQADHMMSEKIEFIRYSCENAFPCEYRRMLWPSRPQMERLRQALKEFKDHPSYIPADNSNNRMLRAISEVHLIVQTYDREHGISGAEASR